MLTRGFHGSDIGLRHAPGPGPLRNRDVLLRTVTHSPRLNVPLQGLQLSYPDSAAQTPDTATRTVAAPAAPHPV